MAGDRAPEVIVFRDSRGAHLVAVAGDESDRAHWPAYLVDEDGTNGPRDLGSWLNFVPSDYAPAEGPYPPAVEELRASLPG